MPVIVKEGNRSVAKAGKGIFLGMTKKRLKFFLKLHLVNVNEEVARRRRGRETKRAKVTKREKVTD